MAEQAPETRVPVPPQIEIIIFFCQEIEKVPPSAISTFRVRS